jgi:hypothetical protein
VEEKVEICETKKREIEEILKVKKAQSLQALGNISMPH